jgi:hypothetical protein
MNTMLQSLVSKVTRRLDPLQPIKVVLFPTNARKKTLKNLKIGDGCKFTTPNSLISLDFRIQGSKGCASPEQAQFQPLQYALNMIKYLAS